jgi:3-methyladenine DNA glycosylase AlkD
MTDRVSTIVVAIRRALEPHRDAVRAVQEKRYLKSGLDFLGVGTPVLRNTVKDVLRTNTDLGRTELLETVHALWTLGVHELRAAAVLLLEARVSVLEVRDMAEIERLIRESASWAYVDALAVHVAGRLVTRLPELASTLDRWAIDSDFWFRRAAMLALLEPLRKGGGDFARFARYADAMLAEREFFIRKAIGWVLREVGKKRPGLVVGFLEPRLDRVSGLALREAIKHLPPAQRTALLSARD